MNTVVWLFFLTGAIPLWRAWQENRDTSLFHTLNWTIAAWAAWGAALLLANATNPGAEQDWTRYIALALTACALMGVFGARRPGVVAWNLALAGLLVVLLLPLAEHLILEKEFLNSFQVVFLGAILLLGIFNYLPTRMGPAAMLLALGCGFELMMLAGDDDLIERLLPATPYARFFLALVPWVAAARWLSPHQGPTEFDRVWFNFRDRYGIVWGQRLREQFNRAAGHNGWPVTLHWQGLRLAMGAPMPEPDMQAKLLAALRALMQRFLVVPEDLPPEEDDKDDEEDI